MTDAVTTPPSHPAKDDDNLILDELSEPPARPPQPAAEWSTQRYQLIR